MCEACLIGHPCEPVPAESTSAFSTVHAEALLQVLLYSMCLGLGRCAAPLPLPASLVPPCAYGAVLAWTRRRPWVHFQHCRFWTLLAVTTVTPLVAERSWHGSAAEWLVGG